MLMIYQNIIANDNCGVKTLQKGKGLCLFRLTVFMSGYIPSIRENEEWQFGHQCNATKWSL